MPSVSISAEELDLESRRIRIRPRLHQPKRRLFSVRPRRDRERYPGEWLEGFDESGLCSYPPEDLVIEGLPPPLTLHFLPIQVAQPVGGR